MTSWFQEITDEKQNTDFRPKWLFACILFYLYSEIRIMRA